MNEKSGTRTLIRGKKRHHPYMFEPSHSLFRVDRFHHRFSMVVGMRPSPDWFLGTTHFELCTLGGWMESAEIPMYPWDAGTMDGVSYEVSIIDASSTTFQNLSILRTKAFYLVLIKGNKLNCYVIHNTPCYFSLTMYRPLYCNARKPRGGKTPGKIVGSA